MSTRKFVGVVLESPQQEHDRLRAQRERIARLYGHQPKQPIVRPVVHAVRVEVARA